MMPELPEVETVVKGLRPRLEGRCFSRCVHASDLMARSDEGEFKTRLSGRRCEVIERHGKWIFLRLDRDETLAIHLGMTGRLSIDRADAEVAAHTHLRVALDLGTEELRFRDPRRFGELKLLSPASFGQLFGPDRLGPEALSITPRELWERMGRTRRVLKAVLLDQRVIAGLGNIYVDEILFEVGLHPRMRPTELDRGHVQAICRAIRRVLKRAIEAGGSTIRDYADSSGREGTFQHRHRVYGRAGLPCKKCRSPIEWDRTIVGGRSTHWCPTCQRSTSGVK